MNYQDLLTFGVRRLTQHQIKLARSEAEMLLSFVIQRPREYVIAHGDTKATPSQAAKYHSIINKRCRHQPVAYLTGRVIFYGQEYQVNRHTLIPRPETEQLIEIAVDVIKRHHLRSIVDVGTGSGVIALALAGVIPGLRVLASDISPKALQVAKKNAQTMRLSRRVSFARGNLLKPWRDDKYDLVIANLPYVSDQDLRHSPTKLELAYEPQLALAGGQDGLALFRNLFSQITYQNDRPAWLILEFGWHQSTKLKKLAQACMAPCQINIIRDYHQIPRIMVIKSLPH